MEENELSEELFRFKAELGRTRTRLNWNKLGKRGNQHKRAEEMNQSLKKKQKKDKEAG